MNGPILSDTERKRRWKGLREAMDERGLDGLLIWGDSGMWESRMANIRYVSQVGGQGEEAVCLFPREHDPKLFVEFGVGEWDDLSWVNDTQELILQGKDFGTAVVEGIRELGMTDARWGIVGMKGDLARGCDIPGIPEEIPHYMYQAIRENLPRIKLRDATDLLRSMRQPKSEEEIRMMEHAARVADYGYEALYESARPGLRENQVYGRVLEALLSHGAENPVQFWWALNGPYIQKLSYTKGRTLKPGDYIVCEFTPIYRGYRQHAHTTVFVGEPPEKYMQLHETVVRAHDACMDTLRPGVTTGELFETGITIIEEAGYKWEIPLFHGMGISWEVPYGSRPGISSIEGEADRELTPGYTISFQQGAVTPDETMSSMVGDVVVVTEDGCRRLSSFPVEQLTGSQET